MPRTVEHIVATHQIADARRRAGKPIWDRKIDIKQILREDQSNTTNEHCVGVAHRIAALLRTRLPKTYLDITHEDYDQKIDDIVDWLEATSIDQAPGSVLEDLNGILGELYDWADHERVWLGL